MVPDEIMIIPEEVTDFWTDVLPTFVNELKNMRNVFYFDNAICKTRKLHSICAKLYSGNITVSVLLMRTTSA